MSGTSAAVRFGVLGAALALVAGATPAGAIESPGGSLQLHGYGEIQVRTLADDFDSSTDWDLAQWYNILNLEGEWEIAPDGWGPFDLVSAFVRAEVRYDCVWTRGCHLFPNANAYGDRAQRLPKRFTNARRSGFSAGTWTGDLRRYAGLEQDELSFSRYLRPGESREVGSARKPQLLHTVPGFTALFDNGGFDGDVGTLDDPPRFVFDRFYQSEAHDEHRSYRFGLRRVKGSVGGVGTQIMPWRPRDKIIPIGALANVPNPFRQSDTHPFFTSEGAREDGSPFRGAFALPYRPAPELPFGSGKHFSEGARGLFYPTNKLRWLLQDSEFDAFDQNFRQAELEWNRGASQQDEKELKEAYVDIEFFDGRLWARLGKQQIVWGKTELFRTTDQFNPQDVALASLPSLEESRIALWAARFVWSFYDVGPLEDVRFEVAMNIDQFEPADLGRCGEPFTPNPVCDKTTGLFAHGITGAALAGEIRPPNPWNSWKGLEVGARLEFRWDRFSIQISDFYGYNDFPYADRIFNFQRNVDPVSGRPRKAGDFGRCRDGQEDACLQGGTDALENHHGNQQLFAVICSISLFFSPALDPSACGQSILNSRNVVAGGNIVSEAVNRLLAGGIAGQIVLTALVDPTFSLGFGPEAQALAELTVDPDDLGAAAPAGSIQSVFSVEQQALLGCGPHYDTNCFTDGPDFFNMEASAVLQSWPGFEGTGDGPTPQIWDTHDPNVDQPGTVGFDGGPVCTRYERGKTYVLPGCRGPGDPDYDRAIDGSTTADPLHPYTGQAWRSEMAQASWNALFAFAALSGSGEENKELRSVFDGADPFRSGKCSFRNPQLCSAVAAVLGLSGVQREIVQAGGNRNYGRRDWVWHGGSQAVLRYEKRNVLGFSMDFAEDFTKSNWGIEFTWIEELPTSDNNEFDGLRDIDTFNLTVSVDRPTFINFLNQNRTFFFNSQWFFQAIKEWEKSFPGNGPINILATFTVQTGYFQDRLLTSATLVYDFQSDSGALLPSFTYRFTENFSAQFGLAFFWGHTERRRPPIVPIGPLGNRAGRGAYRAFVENGLAVVRDRDEIFLRIRYTF